MAPAALLTPRSGMLSRSETPPIAGKGKGQVLAHTEKMGQHALVLGRRARSKRPAQDSRLKDGILRSGVELQFAVTDLFQLVDRLEANGYTTLRSIENLSEAAAARLQMDHRLLLALLTQKEPSTGYEMDPGSDAFVSRPEEETEYVRKSRGFPSYETKKDGMTWVPLNGGFPTPLRDYAPAVLPQKKSAVSLRERLSVLEQHERACESHTKRQMNARACRVRTSEMGLPVTSSSSSLAESLRHVHTDETTDLRTIQVANLLRARHRKVASGGSVQAPPAPEAQTSSATSRGAAPPPRRAASPARTTAGRARRAASPPRHGGCPKLGQLISKGADNAEAKELVRQLDRDLAEVEGSLQAQLDAQLGSFDHRDLLRRLQAMSRRGDAIESQYGSGRPQQWGEGGEGKLRESLSSTSTTASTGPPSPAPTSRLVAWR